MESIKYPGVAMGGKIYSLRMAKRMSREQLAAVLNIRPAAVSKWERNLSNMTLTAALVGASGEVAGAFMSNLSDRMLYFIHEDMKQWNGTEEEMISAQKKVLELENFCLNNEPAPCSF